MRKAIVYTTLVTLGFLIGYVIVKETPPFPCPYHKPHGLRSNLMTPDTALCYWDKEAMYIIFSKPHAVNDTGEVEEENQ